MEHKAARTVALNQSGHLCLCGGKGLTVKADLQQECCESFALASDGHGRVTHVRH
jgi:hypothetical protein